jgi:hypothetical protein
LLKQLSFHESLLPLVDDFKGAGTSRPVALTPEQEGPLLEVIDLWAQATPGGRTALPDGVHQLRNDLTDDVDDAVASSEA